MTQDSKYSINVMTTMFEWYIEHFVLIVSFNFLFEVAAVTIHEGKMRKLSLVEIDYPLLLSWQP